jgi:hypothetical protein
VKQGIENQQAMQQLFKTSAKKSTKGRKLTKETVGEANSGDEGDGEDEDRNVDSRIQTRNRLPVEVSVSPLFCIPKPVSLSVFMLNSTGLKDSMGNISRQKAFPPRC